MLFLFLVLTSVLSVHGATEAPVDDKIVGGKSTSIEKVPYQVSLYLFDSFICGGSIITPQHVLTAAHCVDGAPSKSLSVGLGSNHKKINVKQCFPHQSYNKTTHDFDIAVLQLNNKIKLGSTARTVSLPSQTVRNLTNQEATVSGWGSTKEGGKPSSKLQAVTVTVINGDKCKKQYPSNFVEERMLCAYEPGQDACQGDSGGPLVLNNTQIGIVSFGSGCAKPRYPGVYTDVAKYRDFIAGIIKK